MTDRNTSKSPSSHSRTFSNKITALGAKLSRTLSADGQAGDRDRSAHSALMASENDRSVSRGRDVYQSSGRGGMGNIRNASASRDAKRPEDGPDDFSHSRGREPAPVRGQINYSTGRGGAGNIRSSSRDVSQTPRTPELREMTSAEEEAVIRARAAADQDAPHSTGRGGAGNITSRSISRGRALHQAPLVHSTGRGGAGNITHGEAHALAAELEEETERMKHLHMDGVHSTGRGGSANITTMHGPGIEKVEHKLHDSESTGRGGAGNLVPNGSSSRSRVRDE